MSTPTSPRGPSPAPPDQAQLDDLHKKYQAANSKFGIKSKDFYAALNDPDVDLARLSNAFDVVKEAFQNKENACTIYMQAATGISNQEHRLKACEKTLTGHVDKMKTIADDYNSRKELLEDELQKVTAMSGEETKLFDDTFLIQRRQSKSNKSGQYESAYVATRDEMVALCTDDASVTSNRQEVVRRYEKLKQLEQVRAKSATHWLTCAIYSDESHYQKAVEVTDQDRQVLHSWLAFFAQLQPVEQPTLNISAITLGQPKMLPLSDSPSNETMQIVDTSIPPPNMLRFSSTVNDATRSASRDVSRSSVRDILSRSSIMESIAGSHKNCGTIVERMEGEDDSRFVNLKETHGKKNPSNLQKIDGKDVTLVREFLKAFECKVHRNTRYGWDEKYFELLDHLEHPARQCVALFHPTKEGYLLGLQALETRYASFKTHQGAIWARIGATTIDIHNLNTVQEVKFSAMELLANSDRACYAAMGLSLVSNFEVKMTPQTRKSWNDFLLARSRDTECPSIEDFQDWCRHLETLEAKELIIKKQSSIKPSQPRPGATTRVAATVPDPEGTEIKDPDSSEEGEEDLNLYDELFACAAVTDDGMFVGCPLCDKDNSPASHKLPDCRVMQVLIPSERQSIVRRTRSCRKCLLGKHFAANCPSTTMCQTCNKDHHTLLHRYTQSLFPSTVALSATLSRAQYRVIPVEVSCSPNFERFERVNCSLDDHAGESFIDEKLARQLGCKLHHQSQRVGYIDRTVMLNNYRTSLFVRAIGSGVVTKISPSTSNSFTQGVTPPNIAMLREHYPHLRGIPFHDYEKKPCQLLLGLDHSDLQVAVQGDITGAPMEPIARLTRLGWTVVHAGKRRGNQVLASIINPADVNLNIDKIWRYEELPCSTGKRLISKEDLHAETIVREGLFSENGHLGTRVPFRSHPLPPHLPKNYYQVLKWQNAHEQELMRDEAKWAQYVANFDEWLRDKYIIPCAADIHNSFFIPCFAVIRDDSTTMKLRVVTDCARKFGALRESLNDHIHTGPKLQNDVRDVLLQFRAHQFAFSSDIARMYLQFLLHPDDQRFHKIIFRGQTYQFTRWPFGNVAAPFATLFCLNNHFKQSNKSHLIDVAKESLYMDDVLPSSPDEQSLVNLYQELKETCSQAGLCLRKVVSNSRLMMSVLPSDLLGVAGSVDEFCSSKVLGCIWYPSRDILSFKPLPVELNMPLTKRNLFRVNGLCFDPVGFAEPVTLKGRLLLQDVCFASGTLTWDEPIDTPDFVKRWRQLLEDLTRVDILHFPRALSVMSVGDKSLEVFVDASSRMYSAVIYLRQANDVDITVRFVHCKRRLCKKGEQSIPKKELLAAHLGAIIATHYAKQLKISAVHFWSDSTTVLKWLFRPMVIEESFVSRRVLEILDLSDQSSWKYINTDENPADIATKGDSLDKVASSTLWLQGPPRLQDKIPASSRPDIAFDPANEAVVVDGINAVFATDSETSPHFAFVQDYNAHPDQKMAARQLLKLGDKFGSFANNPSSLMQSLTIWFRLLRRRNNALVAQRVAVKIIQALTFKADLEHLSRCGRWKIGSEPEKSCAYLDGHLIIRARGRLDSDAHLSWGIKRPILLQGSESTKAYLHQWHNVLGHSVTINQFAHVIRRRLFIPKLRQLLRAIFNKCGACKRLRGQPCTPLMGDVPVSLGPLAPFAHIAIDYCGPFLIKRPRGQARDKKYVLVIVCRQTKAVHLEDASDLSTDAFVLSLSRFMARRGTPTSIRSDQGSNFVGTVGLVFKEDFVRLKKIDWEQIRRLTSDRFDFTWTFSPSATPTFNGLAESFVKIFKTHLTAIGGAQAWREDSFRSAIAQAEKLMNDRPLSYVPAAMDDAPGIVTPNHFLMSPQVLELDQMLDADQLPLKEYKTIRRMKQQLWDAWNRSIYNQLASRPKWRKVIRNLASGDVVLIRNRGQFEKKCSWPLGVVETVQMDKNGTNRTASLRVVEGALNVAKNKTHPTKIVVESVANLIPIVLLDE